MFPLVVFRSCFKALEVVPRLLVFVGLNSKVRVGVDVSNGFSVL